MTLPTDLTVTILGCLLHDIGKVQQLAELEKTGTPAASATNSHSAIGRSLIQDCCSQSGDNAQRDSTASIEQLTGVLDSISYHHLRDLRPVALNRVIPDDSPAYITYLADNIASGINRLDDYDQTELAAPTSLPRLASVFNLLGPSQTGQTGETGTTMTGATRKREKETFAPQILSDSAEFVMPSLSSDQSSPLAQAYTSINKRLRQALRGLSLSDDYLLRLLTTLEQTLSFVPARLNRTEDADISLFDHLKLTGAFGSALWHWARAHDITNFREELFSKPDFYDAQAFLLVSADISGIQSFLYTIHSQGAAKQLRTRSFYMEILVENMVDELLDQLALSRSSILYTGGGHVYLVAPNTPAAVTAIAAFEEQFNAWLLKEYGIALYVGFGCQPFCARQIMKLTDPNSDGLETTPSSSVSQSPQPAQPQQPQQPAQSQSPQPAQSQSPQSQSPQPPDLSSLPELYRSVSRQISRKKLNRYSLEQITRLNSQRAGDRECKVCHRLATSAQLDEEQLCRACSAFAKASVHIRQDDTAYVDTTQGNDGVPVAAGQWLHFTRSSSILRDRQNTDQADQAPIRAYGLNRSQTGLPSSIHLWVGNYTYSKEFDDYTDRAWTVGRGTSGRGTVSASNEAVCHKDEECLSASDPAETAPGPAVGICRLACLRLDVDNLGSAFTAGFSLRADASGRIGTYNTFARTATFSRLMSLFFKHVINQLLAQPRQTTLTGAGADETGRRATVIYSGGDDVFIVGAWDDALELAVDLRNALGQFSQGKLTLSGGIGIYPGHFPLASMAGQTGGLAEAAKHCALNERPKDAVTVFDPQWTMHWESLEQGVLVMYRTIRDYLNSQGDDLKGLTFVYHLLTLLRDKAAEGGSAVHKTISFARWAYLLTRAEPGKDAPEGQKRAFQAFKEELSQWFDDPAQSNQLQLALLLYSYSTRLSTVPDRQPTNPEERP